jgi:hypothetical protein
MNDEYRDLILSVFDIRAQEEEDVFMSVCQQ